MRLELCEQPPRFGGQVAESASDPQPTGTTRRYAPSALGTKANHKNMSPAEMARIRDELAVRGWERIVARGER